MFWVCKGYVGIYRELYCRGDIGVSRGMDEKVRKEKLALYAGFIG